MGTNFIRRIFSNEETQKYINVLELNLILFGLESLARDVHLTHIKILCDNSVTIFCTNKFGTSYSIKFNT